MPIPITVPRLGWNMEHGVFVGWLKASGDAVRAGEPLFTLEGEKATEDIEALDDGVLNISTDAPKAGDTVAVGAAIGVILKAGESASTLATAAVVSTPVAAKKPNLVLSAVTSPRSSSNSIVSTPRARRAAAARGIDLSDIQGTGRGGRIRERDILSARTISSADKNICSTTDAKTRRVIAAKMMASHQSTAPVTITTTADATNLVNLRNQFKAAASVGANRVPSYTDFLIKLAAAAMKNHPYLNARWDDGNVAISDDIHIGVAVDTESGLLVPVVRNVPALTLKELSARTHDLIDRTRQRSLSASEMRGGTFTVTSLGSFGIDAFTPIINAPECAILGVGRIVKRPAVVGEQIVPRDQLTLSLTFDHRIVDGAPAARFLQTLVSLIENPGPWLMA